ncbi:hypothetical protein [Shinella sp. M31]|uniref:hypothetical protein n=1 Tax=Shinella sp. M31 TaxID=3368615 RepID=UPI003BA3BD9C
MAAIAIGLVISTATPSYAQAVRSWGVGTTACEEFNSDQGKRSAALDWSAGFISALNIWLTYDTDRTTDLMPNADVAELERRLTDYCRVHPVETVADALTEITLRTIDKTTPNP